MKTRSKDLSSLHFGRLVVVEREFSKTKNRSARWLCKCSCGSICVVRADALKAGKTVSCGCFSKENASRLMFKHGMVCSPEYTAWVNMRRRCNDEKTRHYKNYGGRGISVCEEWENSFENFFSHVGARPAKGYELDRINNDEGYKIGNVRWVLREKNQENRRKRVTWIIFGKKYQTLSLAAAAHNVCDRTISNWVKRGRDGCYASKI